MKLKLETVDAIHKELRRQANSRPDKFKVRTLGTDKPDTVRVEGQLDVYELAEAILDR